MKRANNQKNAVYKRRAASKGARRKNKKTSAENYDSDRLKLMKLLMIRNFIQREKQNIVWGPYDDTQLFLDTFPNLRKMMLNRCYFRTYETVEDQPVSRPTPRFKVTQISAGVDETNWEKDRSEWMSRMPDELKTKASIYQLSIPGSHDSMTYSMTSDSIISPDAPVEFDILGGVSLLLSNWGRTQTKDVTAQLKNGIRYFDIRLCMHDREMEFCHGMFCGPARPVLEKIGKFLETKKEFVILDFQHFFEFDQADHNRLVTILKTIFKSKIATYKFNFEWTYQKLVVDNNFQVIIIYRSDLVKNELFWPTSAWPTDWPETTEVKEMIKYNDRKLSARDMKKGHTCQCVLTPDGWLIFWNFLSKFETVMEEYKDDIIKYIRRIKIGTNNVVLLDFVANDDWLFCKVVINKNTKLLEKIRKKK